MRRVYALENRNPPVPISPYYNEIDDSIVKSRPNDKVIVQKQINDVVEYDETDIRYVENDNVYLNETARCPYFRFPWWCWLLLALSLLTLLGLALGLGLGLGLNRSSRCSSGTCPSNSQCINNRCECNSGYFYDYSLSTCTSYRHVGMTCTTSITDQQCITNAYCASNGYCICDTDYFLDENNGVCTALLSRYTPCANDDQCQTPFVCKVGRCDCNQTSYYDSSSNTCKRLGYVNEPCSINSQCVRTANCSTTSCQCATDHYFDTSEYQCVRKQCIGRTCTNSYECIANANCTSASPFSSQCECNSGYYYETTTGLCTVQLTYGSTCTSTLQCVNNLLCIDDPTVTGVTYTCTCLTTQYYVSTNETCISYGTYGDACNVGGRPCETRYGLNCSTATATCQCSSINYWNGSYCVTLLYPGETCSSSSQCINDSSCVSYICQCNTNYYYSTLTGTCTSQLSYSSTCTLGDYQCLYNMTCYDLTTSTSGTCSCDTDYYYYDGTQCSLYKTYGETCAAATYGPFCDSVTKSLVCIGTNCSCLSTSYYNGSGCVSYTSVGFSCTSSAQCETNAICSSGICICSSSYYFDTSSGVCLPQLSYGQSCTSSTQCSTNMTCTSSVCLCTSSTYYVSPNCVSRATYGESCSATVLCDATLGLVCTASVCACNSTQYWSTLSNGTQICANLRTLGQSCTSTTDCANSIVSVTCVTSICECYSSSYYLDQTAVTCELLKSVGTACTPTYNFECASFNCNSSNVCGSSITSTIKSNVTQATSVGSVKQCKMILNMIAILYVHVYILFNLIQTAFY